MTYLEFKVNLCHISEGFQWHRPEFVILQRPIIVEKKIVLVTREYENDETARGEK